MKFIVCFDYLTDIGVFPYRSGEERLRVRWSRCRCSGSIRSSSRRSLIQSGGRSQLLESISHMENCELSTPVVLLVQINCAYFFVSKCKSKIGVMIESIDIDWFQCSLVNLWHFDQYPLFCNERMCSMWFEMLAELKICWASTPGHGLKFETLKNTTVLLNMTKVGSTQVFFILVKNLGYNRISPHVIFWWFAIKLFHWLGCSYSSWIKNASTVVFFERLAVIGWFPKNQILWAYIWVKRGLAEDFCKLWCQCIH